MECFLSEAAVILLTTLFLAGCQQDSRTEVLKEMPARGTLSYNHVVYVENDGSCDIGQVIKVTGGKKSKGIKRGSGSNPLIRRFPNTDLSQNNNG